MVVEQDVRYPFRMYKSHKTGNFHAIFKELNGAYRIYSLLRLTVAESELPHIGYVGGENQNLCVRGDRGKHEWGSHVMKYVYRETDDDTEFYFLVRGGKLMEKEQDGY